MLHERTVEGLHVAEGAPRRNLVNGQVGETEERLGVNGLLASHERPQGQLRDVSDGSAQVRPAHPQVDGELLDPGGGPFSVAIREVAVDRPLDPLEPDVPRATTL